MNQPLPSEDLAHIFDHCQAIWSDFHGARVFITGGTGFFGCWLLESFAYAHACLKLQAEVVVLTRDVQAFSEKMAALLQANPWIRLQEGDVRDFTFPNGTFTHVIHAATEASAQLNTENPLKMLDVILKGTQHTLDFAVQASAKKVLLASSGAVYGRQPPSLSHVPEDYLGSPELSKPANAYGIGKCTAEHMAALYHYQHGLNVKIARCFAFVGPHLPLDTHFAIGNFMLNGLKGEQIEIKGDGSPYRSYQYAADLVIWLWHILVRGENNYPYNVGSDQAVSIGELAGVVASCFTPVLKVSIAKTPTGQTPERYVPSIDRAVQTLGLSNHIDLVEGIKRTIKWHGFAK